MKKCLFFLLYLVCMPAFGMIEEKNECPFCESNYAVFKKKDGTVNTGLLVKAIVLQGEIDSFNFLTDLFRYSEEQNVSLKKIIGEEISKKADTLKGKINVIKKLYEKSTSLKTVVLLDEKLKKVEEKRKKLSEVLKKD